MVAIVCQNISSVVPANNATATVQASTAGNLMVAIVARSGGQATGALTSVTDSASQSWTRATRGAVAGVTNTRIEIWYKENSQSITSVTFNSGTSQFYTWNIIELSGILTSGALDIASPDYSNTGVVTAVTCPVATVPDATEIVIGAFSTTTATVNSSPVSPWTNLGDFDYATSSTVRGCYQIVNVAGDYTPGDWALATTHNCGVCTVAFASGSQNVNITFNSYPDYVAPPAGSLAMPTPLVTTDSDSPALEVSNFGAFTGVDANDTIHSVRVLINAFSDSALMEAPTYELWDGTSAQIGATQTGTPSTSTTHLDVLTFPDVTYGQLADLRLRAYAHAGSAPSTSKQYVDFVAVNVDYTPFGGLDANITPAVLYLSATTIPVPEIHISVDISATVINAGGNLINESTFEDNIIDGWFGDGVPQPTIEVSTAQAHQGTHSLLITATGSQVAWPAGKHAFAATAGQKYDMDAWVYVPAGDPSVYLLAPNGYLGSGTATTNTWEHLYLSGYVADGVNDVIAIIVDSSPSLAYVDDVVVKPRVVHQATVSGSVSITATRVPGTTTIPTPVVSSSVSITPTRVPGTTTIPTPTVTVGSVITAVVLGIRSVILLPKLGVLSGPNYGGSASGDWVNPSYASGSNNDQYATWEV